jgi:hypothetical protein
VNTVHIAVIILALSTPAFTKTGARLAYEAPEGCPSQPEFVAAVAARGAEFDGAETKDASRVMVVSIGKREGVFAGTFQVREKQSTTDKREVSGPSCTDVTDALAVVTAIALRPENNAPATSATSTPTPSPRASPTSTSPPAPSEERLRANTRIFPPRSETVQVGAGTLRFDLQRSVTAYAGTTVGLVPSVFVPRFDLSANAANFVTTPESAQRIAGLVTQLHVSFLGPATYTSTDTKTDMSGVSFGIGLCQSPRYDTRGLVVLFCGEYGGGIMFLQTKGAAGAQIQSKEAGFGTATFGAEAQYNVGSVFHVGAKLGGGFTIGQLTAERADGSRIFGSSIWTAYGLLGAGVHF